MTDGSPQARRDLPLLVRCDDMDRWVALVDRLRARGYSCEYEGPEGDRLVGDQSVLVVPLTRRYRVYTDRSWVSLLIELGGTGLRIMDLEEMARHLGVNDG